MGHRTSLILDDETRRAARELSVRYGCSVSEAIRRAVIRHRDGVMGISAEVRQERKAVLSRLFELFEANDPAEEIRRLKAEDASF